MMLKLASAFITGSVLAELGWNWYSSTAMTFPQQLQLLLLILLMLISWVLLALDTGGHNADNQ